MMENTPLPTIEIQFTDEALMRFHRRPKNDVKVVTKVGAETLEI